MHISEVKFAAAADPSVHCKLLYSQTHRYIRYCYSVRHITILQIAMLSDTLDCYVVRHIILLKIAIVSGVSLRCRLLQY